MKKHLALSLLLAVLLLPLGVQAAALASARTLVISEPLTENAYLAGTDISLAAPLAADLSAAGGTITVSAPVTGDALLAGGTVNIRKPILGDVRAVAGELLIDNTIGGDLVAAAGILTASTTAKDMRLAGGTIRLVGSGGDVSVYGADVYLSGTIRGDVSVTASDKLFVADNTRIEGTLKYNAPQAVALPASAVVVGGVTYVGSAAYLPTNEEAKRFAVAGAGVLLVVRVLTVLIAAGLVAGLFPRLADQVAERIMGGTMRRPILLALLGFAALVATPVFILILLASFVGIAVALLLAAGYALLLLLAYLYAGVLAGAALSRALFKRDRITWRTAVLGMLSLSLIGMLPTFGILVVAVLTFAAAGTLLAILYQFSFGRASVEDDALLDEI